MSGDVSLSSSSASVAWSCALDVADLPGWSGYPIPARSSSFRLSPPGGTLIPSPPDGCCSS